ncbi:MAG: hypothetical protein JRJ29_17430 [Deltaproteobacteria bacterium]|nr:hypothetical protein [Deltaproteobacteria bacterium]
MISDRERQITAMIDENRGEMVEYLRELIGFETVTPPFEPTGELDRGPYRGSQDLVSESLKGMGCDVEMWEVAPSELEQAPGFGVMPERDPTGLPVVIGRLFG